MEQQYGRAGRKKKSDLISKCRQVIPEVVHYGRKVNSTCYNLIPVKVKGKLWFQLPGSEDLTAEAVEIPCEERPPDLKNQEILPHHLSRPSRGRQHHSILRAARLHFTI